jgi:hypothetical protein
VLIQPRQPWKVDIPDFTVLNQTDIEPEGHNFIRVEQERSGHKVHALNIVNLAVIVGISKEHTGEGLNSRAVFFKLFMVREGPVNVSLDLQHRLLLRLYSQQPL